LLVNSCGVVRSWTNTQTNTQPATYGKHCSLSVHVYRISQASENSIFHKLILSYITKIITYTSLAAIE